MEERILTEEEEAACELLAGQLADNATFQELRGKLLMGGGVLGDLVEQFANETSSPTECLKRYDEYLGRVRVVQNLAAKVKRDLPPRALEEFGHALRIDGYYLPGERSPESKLRTVTAVMYSPRKSFALVDYVLDGHYGEVGVEPYERERAIRRLGAEFKQFFPLPPKKVLSHDGYAFRVDRTDDRERFRDLAGMFPSLPGLMIRRKEKGGYRTWDLVHAWIRDVQRRFHRRMKNVPGFLESSRSSLALRDCAAGYGSRDLLEEYVVLSDAPRILVFEGGPEPILEAFKGSHLKRDLGIWTFRVPLETSVASIGFHPEAEHERWLRQRPLFASRETVREIGAVILDGVNVGRHAYQEGGYVLPDKSGPMRRLIFGPSRRR